MLEFTKESIENAIKNIDKAPELLNGRESKEYDILLPNGKTYPPILVLSEAHKTLGGERLGIDNFNNSTKKPFKILRDLGYKVVSKAPNVHSLSKDLFDFKKFIEACRLSNLIVSEELAIRFISSLITKPFVILTGLSGSGKTKIAMAFTNWISTKSSKANYKRFFIGEEVKGDRVTYTVAETDRISVTFLQSETGTKASLPYELIDEWISLIKKNDFTRETSARDIRKAVGAVTKYSTQLNSFETHLKAAAFHLISKEETPVVTELTVSSLIPVGADWTNREPLLGYPNALSPQEYVIPENGALQLMINAKNNPRRPFFLILDEMNLSHVERYFADFLSAMESKEPIFLHSGDSAYNGVPSSIVLPDNLFIIGTVNIDETTYMFSPKVLDRANVIEFRVDHKEMENFLLGNTALEFDKISGQGESMAEDFLVQARKKYLGQKVEKEIIQELLMFFRELKKVGAEFGYRSASEIIRFISVVSEINPTWTKNKILDAAIMQKLLPKLHGSRRKLCPVLEAIGGFCINGETKIVKDVFEKEDFDFNNANVIYPLSLEKIVRMYKGAIDNGFASFAEA